MQKFKDVYDVLVPPKKRAEDRKNAVLHYVIRPLSIWLSLPLLETSITATTVTKISIVSILLGFGFLVLGRSLTMQLVGWLFVFTWAVLDCVDGNLARYRKQTSAMGELWDSFGGYMAIVMVYFGVGIAAFYTDNLVEFCEPHWMLILGGATSVISIFPRLMMHKKRSTQGSEKSTSSLTDKSSFGPAKTFMTNILSPVGTFQIVFVLCIAFRLLNIFVAGYFVINFAMMMVSLHSILKE